MVVLGSSGWDSSPGRAHCVVFFESPLIVFFVRPTVAAYTVPTMVIGVRAMERHLWMAHDAATDT